MNPSIIHGLLADLELLRAHLGGHDADEILRADMIEGSTDADEVLRQLVKALRTAQADEAGAKAALEEMERRYEPRITAAKKRQECHRKMIAVVMEATGLKSRKLPEGTISLTDGRKSLALADDFTAPQGLQIIEIKPDRKAILDALMAGERIEGADIVIGRKIVSIR